MNNATNHTNAFAYDHHVVTDLSVMRDDHVVLLMRDNTMLHATYLDSVADADDNVAHIVILDNTDDTTYVIDAHIHMTFIMRDNMMYSDPTNAYNI